MGMRLEASEKKVLGLYDKLVKVAGSDRVESGAGIRESAALGTDLRGGLFGETARRRAPSVEPVKHDRFHVMPPLSGRSVAFGLLDEAHGPPVDARAEDRVRLLAQVVAFVEPRLTMELVRDEVQPTVARDRERV